MFFRNVKNQLSEESFYYEPGNIYARLENDSSLIVAPKLDHLININNVSNLIISNLIFTDTDFKADGFWDGPAR